MTEVPISVVQYRRLQDLHTVPQPKVPVTRGGSTADALSSLSPKFGGVDGDLRTSANCN